MGGKPSRGTAKDQRLTRNQPTKIKVPKKKGG